MQTFKKQAAQGDMLIERIDSIPEEAILADRPNEDVTSNHCIIGHSETGHHHVMDRKTTTMYRLPDSIYDAFLVVKAPTALEHQRSFDTHAPIEVPPGNYRIRRQREHSPEGWRRVAD